MKEAGYFALGRSLPRIDVIEKAMGESRYSNDMTDVDALSVTLVGSPRPRLQLQQLDIGNALQTPGVLRVLTAHDIPGKNRLPWGKRPFLVEGEARFYGEPLALVVAEQRADAIAGARAVQISYEEQPAVTNIEQALAEDAPILTTRYPEHPNVWHRLEREQGDVDAALSQSEQVIQRDYKTGDQAAAPIEPQGILARPSSDGGIYLEGSIGAPLAVQSAVSNMLQLPQHRIYVIQRTLGGGSGYEGELASMLAGYAALSTWLTGRAARITLSVEEELRLAGRRPPTEISLKYGVSREGDIQVCEANIKLLCGANPGQVDMAMKRMLAHAQGPYDIPHIRVTIDAIASHTTPCGLLAGYGQMSLSFAQECLIDELARRLNFDPIHLRQQNMLTPVSPLPWQQTPDSSNQLAEALSSVLESSQWAQKHQPTNTNGEEPHAESTETTQRHKHRGVGVALSYTGLTTGNEHAYPPQATVSIRVQNDGSVQVSAPIPKSGVGTRSLLAQLAAESLCVPYHSLHLLASDTLHNSGGAHHTLSPPLYVVGNALLNATKPLNKQLKQLAANALNCTTKELTCSPDAFEGPDGQQLRFAEVVELSLQAGLPTAFYGHASVSRPSTEEDAIFYPAYSYAAHVAEVEIDLETYEIDVISIHTTCDIGKLINPEQSRTEMESQMFIGLGYALIEQLAQENGVVLNGPLLAYPTPEFQDLPTMHTSLLETQDKQGPYGFKGFGDLPAIGVAPAIFNAVANAIGQRLYELPLFPERLFSLIRRKS